MNNQNWVRFVPLLVGLIAILGTMARGCKEGPFGRKQLVTVAVDQENQLGLDAYRQILNKSEIIGGGPIVDAIRLIGRKLAVAADDPELRKTFRVDQGRRFNWEFNVIRDNQVNAFCLPGGKVAVYTGIIPVSVTDAGLAVVMGHEIGHALARHGAERMSQSQLVQMGQTAVAFSLGGSDPSTQRTVMGLLGAGAQFGVLLPFSRSHESEADHIGAILMARAGYDPREAPKFWERMAKATGGSQKVSEFSSTHPSHETRIRDLTNWVDQEAIPLWKRSNQMPTQPLPGVAGASIGGGRGSLSPSPTPKSGGTRGPGYEFK
jgi:metalloendopeptidase OMA1, mitochondrial